MAIISKETFDKFTEEEKDSIRREYDYVKSSKDHDCGFRRVELENIFGKETFQPKIKTWKDLSNLYGWEHLPIGVTTTHVNIISKPVENKMIATAKIAKLIELGYGGMITDEEWKNYLQIGSVFYTLICTQSGEIERKEVEYEDFPLERYFITFRSVELAEEFLSYPENVGLVKQYFQI